MLRGTTARRSPPPAENVRGNDTEELPNSFSSSLVAHVRAAVVLTAAHQALESMVLTKDQARFKERMAIEYADLVYNGLWFSAHRLDLDAYVSSTQQFVTGKVRVRLHKGTATVVGRQSDAALYRHDLATYDEGDAFDHGASEGFIRLYGLATRTQARIQGKGVDDA
ncbi:MAG: argininosuccinate synthase [Planctomycetes bacterium]|nr:argininosuccinate synthase [Planctomycetota bacterium]